MKKPIRLRYPKFFLNIILFLASALGVSTLFWLLSWSMRATAAQHIPDYSAEEIAAAEKNRDTSFDPSGKLPTPFRDVDYSLGKRAIWYPNKDAPVLRELAAAGKLPPVAEQVGPENMAVAGYAWQFPMGTLT
ncbi:hypothetical protein KAH55_07690 [bacterium]|nr:hypothetical protein [bacterium]